VSGTVHIGEAGAGNSLARRGQTFPRTAKLLKHPSFDAVYKGGQRHFSSLMTVFFLRRNAPQPASSNASGSSPHVPSPDMSSPDTPSPDTPSPNVLCSAGSSTGRRQVGNASLDQLNGSRIGFTVGRVLGGSVERNRIRRRMREAVRLNLDLLGAPVDVVINPKKAALTAEFPRIVQEVQRAFAVIEKKIGSR
jgi:ribonuclease P protein component